MADEYFAGKPGPGRPKGRATSMAKKEKQILAKIVNERMDKLLTRSVEIVAADLDATKVVQIKNTEGDVIGEEEVPDEELQRDAARFLLTRFGQPAKSKTYLEQKLITKIENYGDVASLSQEAITLMAEGKMSIEQVQAVQSVITAHAGIAGYAEVEQLRQMLEDMANMKTINGEKVIPEASRIQWGQGIKPTHEGNREPAE